MWTPHPIIFYGLCHTDVVLSSYIDFFSMFLFFLLKQRNSVSDTRRNRALCPTDHSAPSPAWTNVHHWKILGHHGTPPDIHTSPCRRANGARNKSEQSFTDTNSVEQSLRSTTTGHGILLMEVATSTFRKQTKNCKKCSACHSENKFVSFYVEAKICT